MSGFPADKILVGHYPVALGPRGLFRIPKDWRDFFGEDKPVKMLLLPASGPAIWLFTVREAGALRALEAHPAPDEGVAKFRAQFGKPREAVLTAKYEVRLPPDMRRWLGIRKQAILIGCYDHAEIMAPKVWKNMNNTSDPRLAQAIRELGF